MYKPKILVADPSKTVRTVIRFELEQEGYEVIEAKDGNQALEHAKTSSPGLIMLDLETPSPDGFNIFKLLQEEGLQNVPVIFITANNSPVARERSFQLGAVDFIVKPFAKGTIGQSVNKILRSHSSSRQLSALIVDDDSVSRKFLRKKLEAKGFKIHEAKNGKKGFEIMKARRNEIEILITDIEMPEMTGEDLCVKVRKELLLNNIPIIFLTSTSDRSELNELLKSGGTDYLIKPFSNEELDARILVHTEKVLLSRSLRQTAESLQYANKEIQFLSETDPLTGCINKRHFVDKIKNEISRTRRYKHPLSLLFCDLDQYNLVKDSHGEQTGEKLLKTFAQCIKQEIRSEVDWIARNGNDEFMIVLPETDLSGAEIVAQRLRRAVSTIKKEIGGTSLQMTASFGGTGISPDTTRDKVTLDTLVNRANKLLFLSKSKGKNTISMGKLY
ncbi:MAG: response regulator [bacterium]|nr:response regulator [bacterium]